MRILILRGCATHGWPSKGLDCTCTVNRLKPVHQAIRNRFVCLKFQKNCIAFRLRNQLESSFLSPITYNSTISCNKKKPLLTRLLLDVFRRSASALPQDPCVRPTWPRHWLILAPKRQSSFRNTEYIAMHAVTEAPW